MEQEIKGQAINGQANPRILIMPGGCEDLIDKIAGAEEAKALVVRLMLDRSTNEEYAQVKQDLGTIMADTEGIYKEVCAYLEKNYSADALRSRHCYHRHEGRLNKSQLAEAIIDDLVHHVKWVRNQAERKIEQEAKDTRKGLEYILAEIAGIYTGINLAHRGVKIGSNGRHYIYASEEKDTVANARRVLIEAGICTENHDGKEDVEYALVVLDTILKEQIRIS